MISDQQSEKLPYIVGRSKNNGRIVLHADLNNFFASVECANSPDKSLFSKPVAVCGSAELRHGIVLAKNEKAKFYGIKTGESIPDALKKCPRLIILPAHYDLYMRYSRAAREIYLRYTDLVEPFGMDEAWIELSDCRDVKTIADGARIADEIRASIKKELGITASVGVSDNKVFAKLGSDYKKPDATTVFSPAEYESIISKLPVSDILYAGRATCQRLRSYGITTVGQVARKDAYFMKAILGKNGLTLRSFCRGEDNSPVALFGTAPEAKSMGNSTTPPKDIESFLEAKLILSSLCDNVSTRLRADRVKCRGIKIHFRTTDLQTFERQMPLGYMTSSARDLLACACVLFARSVDVSKTPLRSVGISAIDLAPADGFCQMSLFPDSSGKKDVIDSTIDGIRKRFGFSKISTNALGLCDKDELGKIERGYEVFTHAR